MLRLLEDQVQAAERFERFVADARQADQRMQETEQGYAAADVHGYLKAKIAGSNRGICFGAGMDPIAARLVALQPKGKPRNSAPQTRGSGEFD